MVAERVVDVLEMVEVDIEHGRGRAAAPHLGHDGFQPLAEINAVGQAAERVVQREMAQLRFAGLDRLRGAPHVAQHQADQQRKAGQRHCDEGDHALHDLGARPARGPGEARDRLASIVGQIDDVVAAGLGRIVDLAQVLQLQTAADSVEHPVFDEFDGERDRRLLGHGADIAGRSHRDRRNDRRTIEDILHQRGTLARVRR